MSHYDSDYEADEVERLKHRKKRLIKMLEKIKKLKSTLDSNIPERFTDSLEDLNNWIEHSIGHNTY